MGAAQHPVRGKGKFDMYKRIVILAAVIAAIAVPAMAADMPAKAPRGYFEVAGWYGGLGTVAVTTNASVDAPDGGAGGTITTIGAGVGPVIGYHKGPATNFWEAECSAYVMNLGGAKVATGESIRSHYSGGCRAIYGGTQAMSALGSLLGRIDGGVFPPSPVLGPGTLPFVSVGFHVSQIQSLAPFAGEATGHQIVPTFGTGFVSVLTDSVTGQPTGWVTKTSVEYAPPGRGITFGGDTSGANLGRQIFIKFEVVRSLGLAERSLVPRN